jgi:hypothetical protein
MAELTRRYVVMAMATEAPFDPDDPEGVFVLKPWKDPAALRALVAYRDNCYPELSRDLDAWIRAIEAGPSVRGDVGRRNEPHLRAVIQAEIVADDDGPGDRSSSRGKRGGTRGAGRRTAARKTTGKTTGKATPAARSGSKSTGRRASGRAKDARPSPAQRHAKKKKKRSR